LVAKRMGPGPGERRMPKGGTQKNKARKKVLRGGGTDPRGRCSCGCGVHRPIK